MGSTRVLGQVQTHSAESVAHLHVEAWERSGKFPELVEVAETDSDGRFTIELDGEYVKALFLDQRPAFYFRVFRENQSLEITRGSVWNSTLREGRARIIVSGPENRSNVRPASFRVEGRVALRPGREGLRVRVF